jgi:hypothetical protein
MWSPNARHEGTREGIECYLYSYLALALDGKWTALRSSHLYLYSINPFFFATETVCVLRSTNLMFKCNSEVSALVSTVLSPVNRLTRTKVLCAPIVPRTFQIYAMCTYRPANLSNLC